MELGGQQARRWGIVIVLTCLLTFAVAAMGRATNNFGSRTSPDATVTYAHNWLTETTHNSAHDTNTYNVAPTDITPWLYHDVGGKEVSIFDHDYGPTNWYGRFVCENWGSATLCYQGRVDINLYWGPYTQLESDSLMCEEVGHASGLAHSSESSSCMSQRWDRRRWSGHDMSIVNAWY